MRSPARPLSHPATKEMKLSSLSLPAVQHHPSCIPPAGRFGSNSVGCTCFDRRASLRQTFQCFPPTPYRLFMRQRLLGAGEVFRMEPFGIRHQRAVCQLET